MNGMDLHVGDSTQCSQDLAHRRGVASAKVTPPPAHAFTLGSQQRGVNRIINVNQILRLDARSVDERTMIGEYRAQERQDPWPVEALHRLPRSEDSNIAKTHRFEPKVLGEGRTLLFDGQSSRRIR